MSIKTFNFILVGNKGVGKSSYIQALQNKPIISRVDDTGDKNNNSNDFEDKSNNVGKKDIDIIDKNVSNTGDIFIHILVAKIANKDEYVKINMWEIDTTYLYKKNINVNKSDKEDIQNLDKKDGVIIMITDEYSEYESIYDKIISLMSTPCNILLVENKNDLHKLTKTLHVTESDDKVTVDTGSNDNTDGFTGVKISAKDMINLYEPIELLLDKKIDKIF